MKKIFIVALLSFISYKGFMSFDTNKAVPTINPKTYVTEAVVTSQDTTDTLYKDLIATLLNDTIKAEIFDYYGVGYNFDLWNVEFLKVERPYFRSFSFDIKLQVQPYEGPHNTVGLDELLINVSPFGIKVISFEHLKTYTTTNQMHQKYNIIEKE